MSTYPNEKYPTPQMTELVRAIMSLKNETEANNFFRDLFTIGELEEFANRWQIVKLLINKVSYAEIAKKLNTSTTTVTRIAQWLKRGTGGFSTISKRQFGK